MKKMITALLAIILCLPLFTGCLKAEDWIAKGDAARVSGEIDKALEYYQKAGDAGIECRLNIYKETAEEYFGRSEYAKGMSYLQENAGDILLEEDMALFLCEYLRKELNGIKEAVQANPNQTYDEWIDWVLKLGELKQPLKEMTVEGTPGRDEMLDDVHYLTGYINLKIGYSNGHRMEWENIIPEFEKCKSGEGYEIYRAIKTIREHEYSKGAEQLQKILKESELVLELYKYATENLKISNAQYAVAHLHCLRSMQQNTPAQMSLQETFAIHETMEIGSTGMERSIVLTESVLEEIKTTCGNNADGKILILYKWQDYDMGQAKVTIPEELMLCLPEEYFPENIEEVRYVIYLESIGVVTDYEYDNGTKIIRQDTTVSAYRVDKVIAPGFSFDGSHEIWSDTEQGPIDWSTYYIGTPPEYYSAGAPDVRDIIVEACNRIEQDMQE